MLVFDWTLILSRGREGEKSKVIGIQSNPEDNRQGRTDKEISQKTLDRLRTVEGRGRNREEGPRGEH